jgi:hypothetical protein
VLELENESTNDETTQTQTKAQTEAQTETETETETQPARNPRSLSHRAQALGFRIGLDDEGLMNLLVQLDEFHRQEIIEFVEYDERIYEWCVGKGPTSKNSRGEIFAKHGGDVATAGDWYNFASQNMMM